MTIQTKLNIGDSVWFIHDNKVKEGRVMRISIQVIEWDRIGHTIQLHYYPSGYTGYLTEKQAFETKEELLESL